MKKSLAIILALAMIAPLAGFFGTEAAAESVTAKPFYGLTWDEVSRVKFYNLENAL